jgi:SMC interacting uncharacterized protein involved in chromosome segregation
VLEGKISELEGKLSSLTDANQELKQQLEEAEGKVVDYDNIKAERDQLQERITKEDIDLMRQRGEPELLIQGYKFKDLTIKSSCLKIIIRILRWFIYYFSNTFYWNWENQYIIFIIP